MIIDKYNQRVQNSHSLLCVGLDADFEKIPSSFKEKEFPQFEFNKWIIDQTAEFAAAFKPNSAFYEGQGDQGIKELKMTMEHLQQKHPDIFTILDAKRADIGNTNNGYVASIFDWLGFDAVTLHPYLGKEALKPFLDRKDKISIILCRTSNPGAGEFQDLSILPPLPLAFGSEAQARRGEGRGEGQKLSLVVAEKVSKEWNTNNNCMLVVGATYPEEMQAIRVIAGDMTFLVPGIGAQGGDVEAAVRAGINSQKMGMIINSSRGIIFAENPAEEAKKLRDEINKYR